MKTDNITLNFNPDFVGTMTSPTGTVLLGEQTNGVEPYHLLYGALGSCFYATFLGITKKKRLTFTNATIEVSGRKRDLVPPTLEEVLIKMVIFDASDEAQFLKSAELGTQYCSIHETISKVAKMSLEVSFQKS